jgi:hypothetical protein
LSAPPTLTATTYHTYFLVNYISNPQSRALGKTVSELDLTHAKVPSLDKTLFSMCLRDITASIPVSTAIAIVGIEAHVCVLQTTLDLLKQGHRVYVLADGVSSCNREEVPIAVERMRQAGAFVSTSESFVSPPRLALFCCNTCT